MHATDTHVRTYVGLMYAKCHEVTLQVNGRKTCYAGPSKSNPTRCFGHFYGLQIILVCGRSVYR